MFFIPGFLISLLTFPGVIVHEIAHRFFCDIAKVPVYQVKYLRFGNPAGYVIHGEVKGLKNSLLISVGPLIVNTVLCALLTFSAVFPFFILDASRYNPVFLVLGWIGYSIGMHAFPSKEDMENFNAQVLHVKGKGLLYFIAKFFSLFIHLANLLSIIWFDLIYAIGVSLVLPLLLMKWL